MFFAYFDFMHRHGWLSREGRIRDYAVVLAPVLVIWLLIFGLIRLVQ